MRFRPTVVLPALAVTALVLASCSSTDPTADASPTPAPSDLCSAAAPDGETLDGVTATGEVGESAVVEFEGPIEIASMERRVVVEGDGEALQSGEYMNYALAAYDAESGDELGVLGYEPGELLPIPVSADYLGEVTGCATVGSRILVSWPSEGDAATGTATPGQIYAFDILGTTPLAAWGEEQQPQDGFPTVELAENGEPTVSNRDGIETPESTEIGILKQGDGETVRDGDTVMVQYTGVALSDGETFDSSWTRGAPAQFVTNQVVPGFSAALVDQQVGSQVVAVIPPVDGYGGSENELADETLIFVVDILATAHPAEAETVE